MSPATPAVLPSNSRLVGLDERGVNFRYKDYTTKDTKSVHLLARQPVDPDRPHPFTAAGNTEFNCLLWMPPISSAPATSCSWTRRTSRPCSAARTV